MPDDDVDLDAPIPYHLTQTPTDDLSVVGGLLALLAALAVLATCIAVDAFL